MSTVVDATVTADEFALAGSLREHPEARFEICRAVANATDEAFSFLWGSGSDLDGHHQSMQVDSTIQDVDLVSEFDEEYLFNITWKPQVHLLFGVLLDQAGSALLDAYGKDRVWHLRLVYPQDKSIEAVCEECEDLGVTLDVERVYPLSDTFTRDQFQLTEKQFETVMAAYEGGYYDIPRKINLKELARRLDVSHQALSERLRRGHEALIANGLEIAPDGSVVSDANPGGQMTLPPLAQSTSD